MDNERHTISGLSPHARGTYAWDEQVQQIQRFIPACAGNMVIDISTRLPCTVYPRMRGEHDRMIIRTRRQSGLSPHARGTSRIRLTASVAWRFIPACAGNISYSANCVSSFAVYPRMRGEHRSCLLPSSSSIGLSPHARGTSEVLNDPKVQRRFIPACAGNIPAGKDLLTKTAVYPRMRGEHGNIIPVARAKLGLSPHARGTSTR